MIKLVANDGEKSYGIKEYVIDTPDDIKSLPPCMMGSSALVISTGEVYIINSEKKWVKI